MTELAINYQDIVAASLRIRGHAVITPLLESPMLNEQLGGECYLKAENLQRYRLI